jgi:hypothetical protein
MKTVLRIPPSLLLSIIVLVISGCFDEGGPITAQQEHFIVFGMTLSDEKGQELYKVLYRESDDTLRLSPDTTYYLRAQFFDRDTTFKPAPESEDYWPQGELLSINDSAIGSSYISKDTDPIQILPYNSEELESKNLDRWTIAIKTGSTGTASFRLLVIHIDHSDYINPPIPVTVQ